MKKQQEMRAKEKAAASRKMMKAEKEEQFRWSIEDGAFKMQASKDQLIKCFKTILDRHRKRQTMRNEIMLGHAPRNVKVHSKHYDDHTTGISEGCMNENTFQVLIENYEDFDCYSTDLDQQIDELATYGYAGTSAMHS